jgi:PAS domain S-box-containing protein
VLGYERSEVIGRKAWEFMTEASQHHSETVAIPEFVRRGWSDDVAYQFVKKNGEVIDVELSAIAERDENGNISRSLTIVTDVTERKRTQAIAQRREEYIRSVVHNVIDGIITIDDSGHIETINPAVERLFGYSSAELVGQNVRVLMPEPYHSEHDGYLTRYLETEEARIIGTGREVVGKCKDGSTFPMELAIGSFSVSGQRKFTGIIRDITERKQAEESLQKAHDELEQRVEARTVELQQEITTRQQVEETLKQTVERLSLLVGSLPVVPYTSKAEGDFGATYISDAVVAVTGYPPEAFTSNASFWSDHIHPEDQQAVYAGLNSLFEKDHHEHEYRWQIADGSYRWFFDVLRLIKKPDGTPDYIVGAWVDITVRKQVQAATEQEHSVQEAEARVRLRIAEMSKPEDLYEVAAEISLQLEQLGVSHSAASIQIVNSEGSDFVSFSPFGHTKDFKGQTKKEVSNSITKTVTKGISWPKTTDNAEKHPWVIEVWQTGSPRYEPCVPAGYGLKVGMSLIDVPFSQGTLAINNQQTDAFGEVDITLLQRFAGALSEGFQRFLDIVDRTQAQDSLQRSEERYRHLYTKTPAMLHSIDPAGRLVDVSDQWLEVLGYERSEVIGRKSTEFLTEDSKRYAREVTLPEFYKSGFSNNIPFQSTKKNGDIVDILLSATAERDEKGNITRSLSVLTDVTARKRAEDQLATANEALRGLSRRLVQVQEEERRSLAQQLHDDVGQLLTGVRHIVATNASMSPIAHRDRNEEAVTLVDQVLDRVRGVSRALHPLMLEDLGLLPALRSHFERYKIQTKIHVTFEWVGLDEEDRFGSEVERGIYGIVQEALTNVARHAGVSEAWVSLRVESGVLRAEIEDRGKGFEIEANGLTMGQEGMKGRAELLGGDLEVKSAPGEGTRIVAEVPL